MIEVRKHRGSTILHDDPGTVCANRLILVRRVIECGRLRSSTFRSPSSDSVAVGRVIVTDYCQQHNKSIGKLRQRGTKSHEFRSQITLLSCIYIAARQALKKFGWSSDGTYTIRRSQSAQMFCPGGN